MSLALLFHYLMPNIFRNVGTSILRSLWLICWVISWVVLLWIDVCWCFGVVSLCRLKHCFSLHKDTTPPQSNHTVTPTHIEPEQYNPWNKSQAPEDGCTDIRNMLGIKYWNNKASILIFFSFFFFFPHFYTVQEIKIQSQTTNYLH